MIVNYIVDGVDTVRNYQKQFSRLLKKKDFNGIIEVLDKNIKESKSE
jgi:ABC-type transporter MlaC component